MNAKWISAALGLALAPCALASSLTVTGTMGGRVHFDGRDYGAMPVKITQVTPGTHTVKVVTNDGVEKSWSFTFEPGKDANPAIDMDEALGRTAWREDGDRARRAERERRRYGSGYYGPYYGGDAGYPYGGYSGYPYGYGRGPYGGYGRGGGIGIGTSFGGRRRGGFGGSGLFFGLGF